MVGNRCQTARCWKELPVLGILSSVTQYYDQKGSYCRGLVSKYAKILFTTVHDLYTIFWTFTFKSSNRKQGVFLTLRTTGRRKRKMFAQQLIQMHTNAGSVFSGDSAHGYRTQTPNCIRALQTHAHADVGHEEHFAWPGKCWKFADVSWAACGAWGMRPHIFSCVINIL